MTAAAGSRCAGRRTRIAGLTGAVAIAVVMIGGQRPAGQETASAVPGLRPTAHDPVPSELSSYWLTQAAGTAVTPALRDFARAVAIIDDGGDTRSVLPLLQSSSLDTSLLGDHVRYYRGLAALGYDDLETAEAAFGAASSGAPSAIAAEALVRLGETHERQGRYAAAAAAYAKALAGRPVDPGGLAYKLGVALERAGDLPGSIAAHRRVYFEYPLSPDASASGDVMKRLGALDADFDGRLLRERARRRPVHSAALGAGAYGL